MSSDEMEMEITMEGDQLYKEEVFTDRRVGTIQRLTRVDAAGDPVPGEKAIFVGQTQLMTRAGPLPLSFEIPAASLTEAAAKFGEGANKAMEDTVKRLEELRREQSSSIIVPEGTAGVGGVPGGGQIKMP